jgi:hypothetical protein
MTYTLLIMGFAITGFLSMQECQDAGKKAIEAASMMRTTATFERTCVPVPAGGEVIGGAPGLLPRGK